MVPFQHTGNCSIRLSPSRAQNWPRDEEKLPILPGGRFSAMRVMKAIEAAAAFREMSNGNRREPLRLYLSRNAPATPAATVNKIGFHLKRMLQKAVAAKSATQTGESALSGSVRTCASP